ncbi:MAG: gamma-glutamyl-gamma-aminobutyrate hydrolase family protein [Methylotenera sp.]|nr:gamma-glutamyl-gamma-aminobutyrate hydrolase family protein [Methylotenera sp.]
MIVAITQRIDRIDARNELRDSLDQRMVQWLSHAGVLSVPVPNALVSVNNPSKVSEQSALQIWLETVQPNALVLSGGNDIGEHLQRDATESYLLTWAQTKKIPVLGICRGLQMIAVWAGVSLIKVEAHAGVRHVLKAVTKNEDWPTHVNSFHNWGLESCPVGFDVMAQTEDGSIEAIRHQTLPWEGWMWHPERESPFNQIDEMRFRALLNIRT